MADKDEPIRVDSERRLKQWTKNVSKKRRRAKKHNESKAKRHGR